QAPPPSGGPMALPASFSGEAAECHGFLLQVSLYIEMHPHSFPNERAKVAFLISLLTGRALAWARALWSAASPALTTYAAFTRHFTEVFSTAPGDTSTADQLLNIHQGRDSVSGYSLRFRTLAASAGWNEKALLAYCTPLIVLQVGVLHQEEIQLLVLEDSTVDVILGRPWLAKHSPICSWDPCDILEWGPACRQKCLLPLPTPIQNTLTLAATQVEGAPQPVQVDVPQEYHAFSDVFSEEAATLLPPHRPWDCAIDLRLGAKLPKGRVYPLSAPEHQAMESYIQQALRQGFITQSSSPAASSFFFVSKKDGGLCPCIDYRALNALISPLPYPLPLVPAALEDLREARIFTKLDLRSAYNLVRIRKGDEWKTAFITPSGHYEYRVMPYGLSIAPAVFQNFMNEV
ncbi:hypothetical protein HF521_022384, partial [Silurus meridionalis]